MRTGSLVPLVLALTFASPPSPVAGGLARQEEAVPNVPGDPRARLDATTARRITRRVHAGRDLTPQSWPGGRRVAVALTFDLDAELVWMARGERSSPGELSRGAYGPRAGLRRILELLDRRDRPATFFFPALILELHPEAVAAIRRQGRHEIGFHGWAHENVGSLTRDEERETLRRGLAAFRHAGLEPRAYRSPAWDFSPSTLTLLEEAGFSLDSSLMGDDRPYALLAEGRTTDLVELPVAWELDDWPHFQLEWDAPLTAPRDPQEVLALWSQEFDAIRAEGGLFMLTLHPQVIGRPSRMRMLDALLDHIDRAGDAWYATVSEIAASLAGAPAAAAAAED